MKLKIFRIIILPLFFYISLPSVYAQLPLGSHCNDLGGDPSAIIPGEQSTGFSDTNHYAALVKLAQNTSFDTSVSVGAGEAASGSPVFYISTNGGNGEGTKQDPWSLAWANHSLQAGDIALLFGGTYDGMLSPTNAGTKGNPIAIKAAPGAKVHIRGLNKQPAIKLRKDYILVEGFTVSYKDGLWDSGYPRGSNIDVSSDHVTVRNMKVVNKGDYICQGRQGGEVGIAARGSYGLYENNYIERMRQGIGLGTNRVNSIFNVIRGNTIADPVWDGIYIGRSFGKPLGHLIEKNVIYGGLGSDGITFNSPKEAGDIKGVIVRNNAIFTNAENNIDLKGTTNIVIEGNYLWGALGDNDGSNVVFRDGGKTSLNHGKGQPSITKGAGAVSKNVIIRNNVILDNSAGTLAINHYKVYNNTILNNRRTAANGSNSPSEGLNSRHPEHTGFTHMAGSGPNAAILNNIVGDNAYEVSLYKTGSARIDGNAYYNTFQTAQFTVFSDKHDWISLDFVKWQAFLQIRSNYTGDEIHSQLVDDGPADLFVNVPGQPTGDPAVMDFSLKPNSSAIDSGVFLTETVESGSGTTMEVRDAGMFMDGFGITTGDNIQLEGQTQTAKVVVINGDKLTLDQELTWSSGTGVSLAYEGNRPDVGAVEFGAINNNNGGSSGGIDNRADTDGEGILDADDVLPTNSNKQVDTDSDDDGSLDVVEIAAGTNPLDIGSMTITTSSFLVAHYTFDNISGITVSDQSGNGFDAKMWGPEVVSGKIGTALQFDGANDFVDSGKTGIFDVTGQSMTLAAWIKMDDFGIHDARIISKATGGITEQDHYWMLSTMENNGSKLRFRLKTDGLTTTLIGTDNIPTGRWVHAAATYDGRRMRLYIDGKEGGSIEKTGDITTNSNVGVRIGDNPEMVDIHRPPNPTPRDRNFDGAIDDVRVYNLALSAIEIQQLLTVAGAQAQPEPVVEAQPELVVEPSGTPSTANLIFDNGFEKGSTDWSDSDAAWKKVPANVIPSSNAREGSKSVHFLAVNNQKRSELVAKNGKGTFKWGEEYWVGFSLNVLNAPDGYNIISQHHSAPHLKPDGSGSDWSCGAGGNSFTILANNGNFDIRTATNPSYVEQLHHGKGNALWGSQVVSKPYQLKKWHDFVLHFKYATDNTGFMEIWLDGKKVVNKHNTPSVYFYDTCDKPKRQVQYQKIGSYYGVGNKAGEILYDAFRVGDKNASYADVAPRGK